MIVNLTPIRVDILNKDGSFSHSIVPSGRVAALDVCLAQIGEVDSVPVQHAIFGKVLGLPAPKKGTFYVVPKDVATALPQRTDLLYIAAGDGFPIRDYVVSCKALVSAGKGLGTGPVNPFGQPLLTISPTDTPKAIALAKAALADLPGQVRPNVPPEPLADVAGSFGIIISDRDLRPGLTVESPCHLISSGLNSKRPLFLVAGSGVYALAVGKSFGRESSFGLCMTPYDISPYLERLLSPAAISRIIAATKTAQAQGEVTS